MRIIKNIPRLVVALVLFPLLQSCASNGGVMDMSGSFNGWRQLGDANWRLEGSEFVADAGNGHLVTQESFEDFNISLEFWASEGANSGVFVRAEDPNAIADTTAYEVNIYDNRADQTYRTGGVVHIAAPASVINTPGHWNTYNITVDGDHIVVVLNGVQTVDVHDSTHTKSGPITLQYGAGVVKFRNITIKKL